VGITDNSGKGLGKTLGYIYDGLNRLTAASVGIASSTPIYSQTYIYDADGNITNNTGTSYTYAGTSGADPDAPTTIGATNYTYDANGASTHAYDQNDSRVKQTAGGTTTFYPNQYEAAAERRPPTTSTWATRLDLPDPPILSTSSYSSRRISKIPLACPSAVLRI
jgi:hypothetical protein